MEVVLTLADKTSKVIKIQVDGRHPRDTTEVSRSDKIHIILADHLGIPDGASGEVVCDPNNMPLEWSRIFNALITNLAVIEGITPGFKATIESHYTSIKCEFDQH